MKRWQRRLSGLLSAILLQPLLPAAAADMPGPDVDWLLDEQDIEFDGGFLLGTYDNTAAVWENVYYNPETGETRCTEGMNKTYDDDYSDQYDDMNSEATDDGGKSGFNFGSRYTASTKITTTSQTLDRAGEGTRNITAEFRPKAGGGDSKWYWQPMCLMQADKDGLRQVSCYYAELTGLSETGHAAARDFDGKWGVINYLGDVICPFDCDRISELEGYTTTNVSEPTSSKKGFQFGRVTEEPDNPDLIIRPESEKARYWRNGYLIVPNSDGRSDIWDESEESVLPEEFTYCRLSDVSNTGLVWAGTEDGKESRLLAVLQIGGEALLEDESDPPIIPGPGYDPWNEEYIYDEEDEELVLPVEELDKVTDPSSVTKAVRDLTGGMTPEQKESPNCRHLASLYAETAAMRAASKEVSDSEIVVNRATMQRLTSDAVQAAAAAETALKGGGVEPGRRIRTSAVLTTDERAITIRLSPDLLDTKLDRVRVETPGFALSFWLEDLRGDLTEELVFKAKDIGAGFGKRKTTGRAGEKTVVAVEMPEKKLEGSMSISMTKEKGSKTYQAVVQTNGEPVTSKYNPATALMDGKISTSGSYTVKKNEKDFSDIANKSAEMQAAIRYLASKGVVSGTTETTFSPDKSINRAEIAAMIVKALGEEDRSATASFTDIARSSWYYAAAASSEKRGYIKGYGDRTFRGLTTISTVQIISVASRVTAKRMGYAVPAEPEKINKRFSDGVAFWAEGDVALAVREGLVLFRRDGTFSGDRNMTRGDAAIIIRRLFKVIDI